MGILARAASSSAPAKAPSDDVLLLHGLMSMAAADGVIECKEIATLEAFFNTLPEFEDKDFDDLMLQARKLAARYETPLEAVQALADIKSPIVRRKLFVLAADLAMSSGDVDQTEDEMLEAMGKVMNIDEITATKVIDVLAFKYAK